MKLQHSYHQQLVIAIILITTLLVINGVTPMLTTKRNRSHTRSRRSISESAVTCPNFFQQCGSACYNKSVYRCSNNQLCTVNNRLCGSTCYTLSSYNCYSGSFLCPINRPRCGGACYDPIQYKCVNNVLSLRGNAADSCGCTAGTTCCNTFTGNRCYNPSTAKCVDLDNGSKGVCPSNKIGCIILNAILCINPSRYYCDYGNTFGQVCTIGSYSTSTGQGPTCSPGCPANSGSDCVPS